MPFFGDVSLIIGYEDGGEGQGDDEADEAQQGAPYGERQQQYGRVEAHGLAHDFWCYHHVAYYLYDAEHGHGSCQYYPEVLSCVGSLEQGKEHRGDEREGVQIGHKVHYAYHYAEAYGHGKVYYGEAYAEHDAHAERHERLAAYVVVELALHVAHQLLPERAHLLREYLYPFGGERLIVEQDEEHVHERYERCHHAYDDVGRLSEHAE